MVALCRVGNTLLHDVYQPLLEGLSCLPDLRIRHFVDALEARLVVVVRGELWTEHTGVDLLPLGRGPSRIVDTVGHVADEQFLRLIARIDAAEYLLADIPVQH